MTTSSSDRNCTRISPSAVLDNRLEEPESAWALEHLKECDICRDRVEEFREILVRVERLPSARAGAPALAAALHWAIPESLRSDQPETAGAPPDEEPAHTMVEVTSMAPAAPPRAPEVTTWSGSSSEVATPDWYRPVVTPTTRIDEATHPAPGADRWRLEDEKEREPPLPFATGMPAQARQTVIDSGEDSRARPKAASSEVAELRDELQATDELAAAEVPPRESNVLRVAVGVVAAACILLAGLLYGNSGLWRVINSKAINPSPSVAATVRPSASPSPRATVSPAASVAPTVAPTAAPSSPPQTPVVATVGDGASGVRLFRVRYGTAVVAYTRVVFDMTGQGLPTMVITRPDELHMVATFKNVSGAGVGVAGCPCGGRIARLQPPDQQGPDLVIVIDLLRAVRPDISTLPPDGNVAAWRLVIDLYNA